MPAPLEVIVVDNGSTDGTGAEFERWQAEEPRLRYLRIEPNRGTPAPARNLGVASAAGDWVAFLDDDDRWLPGKLALQTSALADDIDVIATDAIRSDGRAYFGFDSGPRRPSHSEIERANPVILSTALVRRCVLLDAEGFDEDPAIAGAEDYELLLRLADGGAHFVILDAPTVRYCDRGEDRLSDAPLKTQRVLVRVRLRRWLQKPGDWLRLRSALRECTLALWSHLASSRPAFRRKLARQNR